MKQKILALISLVLSLCLLSACTKDGGGKENGGSPAAGDENQTEETSLALTDMAGREILLDAPAERIVTLTASDCEILYAIGAGGAVVGRGTYCDYPEDVLSKPEVSSGQETNIEEIIALEPDVVLMGIMAQTEDQVAALEKAGISCVVSDAQDIEGVYEAIRLISRMTGRDAEGERLIGGMETAFADIEGQSAGSGGTVYFEVSSLLWGDPWTAGGGTFMDEIAAMLKLTNIFSDLSGWAEISEEQVIERNPDYIVTIEMYAGEGPAPDQEILSREGWQDITAVKNKAVFNADNNEISRPGPRLVNAAEALYDFVYGSAESDAA